MALKRPPYPLGAEIPLMAAVRTGPISVTLTTPSGVLVPISTARGSVNVKATEVGTWTYSWGLGDEGTFEVMPPADAPSDVPMAGSETVYAPPGATDMPAAPAEPVEPAPVSHLGLEG